MKTKTSPWLSLFLFLLVPAVLPGSHNRASSPGPGTSEPISPKAGWPARYLKPLQDLAGSATENPFLFAYRKTIGLEGTTSGEYVRVIYRGSFGRGVVSEIRISDSPQTIDKPSETIFEELSWHGILSRRKNEPPRTLILRFVSCAASAAEMESYDDYPNQDERWLKTTHFYLYEPSAPPTRGLIVHLSSLEPGPLYEYPVITELCSRGWAVLRMPHAPSGTLDKIILKIDNEFELESISQRLAHTIDGRLAEFAYAVETVLAYLAEHRPDIPQHPMVAMGYSMGALGLPAVIALMPERFDAAVLVGGGANILEMAQDSILFSNRIEIRWPARPPSSTAQKQLIESYLRHSKLDPYTAVAQLAGKPVLLLHAKQDAIVPARTGDLLFERLNKPERWNYQTGHLLLFANLLSQTKRLADWVEEAATQVPKSAHEGRHERRFRRFQDRH